MHSLAFRTGLAALLGLMAAAGNLIGGYFVVRGDWSRKYLQYFLALGAGYMLAVAFVEVIPESVRLSGERALSLCPDRIFPRTFIRTHALRLIFILGKRRIVRRSAITHARTTVLLGLGIHTFFDGVAIAAGFLVSTWLGVVIFVAVFLHKLPEGFTVASVVLASGMGKRNAILAAGLLGVATLLGVLLTSALQGQLKYALPVSGRGDLICGGYGFATGGEPGAQLADGTAGVRGCGQFVDNGAVVSRLELRFYFATEL